MSSRFGYKAKQKRTVAEIKMMGTAVMAWFTDQGDPDNSNDENGGSPGDPGRKGGNG